MSGEENEWTGQTCEGGMSVGRCNRELNRYVGAIIKIFPSVEFFDRIAVG